MGQDLDPGRGWEYRPLCSVTPLTCTNKHTPCMLSHSAAGSRLDEPHPYSNHACAVAPLGVDPLPRLMAYITAMNNEQAQ